MPCGRMSIASRSRSCDLRPSAIAASASARVRSISAHPAGARELRTEGFELGLAGRPKILTFKILAFGAGLRFFCRIGRVLGMARSQLAFCVCQLSAKGLKKLVSHCRKGFFGISFA